MFYNLSFPNTVISLSLPPNANYNANCNIILFIILLCHSFMYYLITFVNLNVQWWAFFNKVFRISYIIIYIGIREEWGKWAATLDFVEKFGELGSEKNYFYMIHRTECEKLDMQLNTSDNSKYADISFSLNVHLSVWLVSASY